MLFRIIANVVLSSFIVGCWNCGNAEDVIDGMDDIEIVVEAMDRSASRLDKIALSLVVSNRSDHAINIWNVADDGFGYSVETFSNGVWNATSESFCASFRKSICVPPDEQCKFHVLVPCDIGRFRIMIEYWTGQLGESPMKAAYSPPSSIKDLMDNERFPNMHALTVTNIVVTYPCHRDYFSDEDRRCGLDVKVLFDKAVDPSAYQVMDKDVALVASADAYFSFGMSFDEELIRRGRMCNPKLKVFTPANTCELIANDPYVWLNPINGLDIINELRRRIYTPPKENLGGCGFILTVRNHMAKNGYTLAITDPGFKNITSFYGAKTILFSRRDGLKTYKEKINAARTNDVNRVLAFSFQDRSFVEKLSSDIGCKTTWMDPAIHGSITNLELDIAKGFLEKCRKDEARLLDEEEAKMAAEEQKKKAVEKSNLFKPHSNSN